MFLFRYLKELRGSAVTTRDPKSSVTRQGSVGAAEKDIAAPTAHKAGVVEVISATRHDEQAFWARSALGQSLRRLRFDERITHSIAFENKAGLSEIYNRQIRASKADNILLFVHDDVWINDFFLAERLLKGLETFDVIGVAGNKRRVPRQPAWIFGGFDANGQFAFDDPRNFSGAVAHGDATSGEVSNYGEVPAACELLDGVLLAARRTTLLNARVLFDPDFRFHFYDMDFCRTARRQKLRLGTWKIAITHQSEGDGPGGNGSVEWRTAYATYLSKWD
jgi:Glycosyltransferase like family